MPAGVRPAAAQPLAERIHSYLLSRPGAAFSGVLVVARGDSVLFERAYGLADAELEVPVAVSHRFNVGSVTKPITATAVLRLVQRSALRLDNTLCGYLQQCPAAWRTVSLRQLLSHSSGIADLFSELPAAPADSLRAVVDSAVARHLTDTLRFPAGQRYAYSNFNYILLGYVLERADGKPWEAVLRDEVFIPAVMRASQYDDVWAITPGRVRGYELKAGVLRNIRYRDHAAWTAGGILSTAQDLRSFADHLFGGKLIADSLVRLMTTPGHGDYGLGWQVVPALGRRLVNHTGGNTGFASHLARYDDGTTIVLLSNVEDESAKATACDVAALVFGLQPSDRGRRESPCRPAP